MTRVNVNKALISVSDKAGLEPLGRTLIDIGAEMISSGGTHRFLTERSIPCRKVEDVTAFPEMLGGRVKTLHPNIFGGILSIRDDPQHRADMRARNLSEIDLVVVNLYPFEQTIEKEGVTLEEAIEKIDIGGPSLIRAAAKNYRFVTVVVDPGDYLPLIEQLEGGEGIDLQMRKDLALKAFNHTSSYDIAIANYLQERFNPGEPWGDSLRYRYERVQEIRYGENPHQKGAYFKDPRFKGVSVANSEVLWGKALSYNNIYDIDAVMDILMEFPNQECCAIVKHNNPSGVALGRKGTPSPIADAYIRALECDDLSAFGGIIGLNRECDLTTAQLVVQRFFEVVVAPSYDGEALDLLKSKKNLRIIRTNMPIESHGPPDNRMIKVRGGALIQTMKWPETDPMKWDVVSKRKPSDTELEDMAFASRVVKHVKSNCVVLARDLCTTGIGAGQMSRVDSCFMAVHKAGDKARGSVLSSDAFFPFRDGIDELAPHGIVAVAQPGGSIRDKEIIKAIDDHGMSMVFTGVRLFKH